MKFIVFLTLFLGTNEKELENKRSEISNIFFFVFDHHFHSQICRALSWTGNLTSLSYDVNLSIQRKSLPCNPKNIDKFVEYHLDRGDNITDIMSKVLYIQGDDKSTI